MGLLKKFFNQTRKPEGALGGIMLATMNPGHASMADWGLDHLPELSPAWAVDLGCGAGRNAGALLERYPQAHVTAVDYSPLSVEKAKKYNAAMIGAGRCDVRQGDVSVLALPMGSYDLATAFETVYFWPGLEKCFRQVAKVLKPGGYFLVVNEMDGRASGGVDFEKIVEGMKTYTAEEIEAAMRAAGFSRVTAGHHPQKNWIAVLAQK